MKCINVFICIIFITSSLSSQNINDWSNYKNNLKFTPSKLLGFVTSECQISYERSITNKISIESSFSYLLPTNILAPSTNLSRKTKGNRIGIEIKHYLFQKSRFRFYGGLEFSRLKKNYETSAVFGEIPIFQDTFNINYTDSFLIKKRTESVNCKVEIRISKNRFLFALNTGIGLKHRSVKHFNRMNPEDSLAGYRHPNFYFITNKEGEYWTLNIPLNFKIGWMF